MSACAKSRARRERSELAARIARSGPFFGPVEDPNSRDENSGSICWHVGGTTDSFGPELRPITDGLGLLPYSNGVHYDSEERRRPLFQSLIADGTLPAGYATDDGVGLLYRGTEFVEAVAEIQGKRAYYVERGPDGTAVETALETRVL